MYFAVTAELANAALLSQQIDTPENMINAHAHVIESAHPREKRGGGGVYRMSSCSRRWRGS